MGAGGWRGTKRALVRLYPRGREIVSSHRRLLRRLTGGRVRVPLERATTRTRTPHILLTRQALYLMSYGGNTNRSPQSGFDTGPKTTRPPPGLAGTWLWRSAAATARFAWNLSESNRPPPRCRRGALPDELRPLTCTRPQYHDLTMMYTLYQDIAVV